MFKGGYQKGDLKYDSCNYEGKSLFYLPHQCDDWLIGDKENLDLFLEDIKECQENT